MTNRGEILKEEINVIDDGWCFVCGKNNPIGLKQTFSKEGDEFVAYVSFPKELQGFGGIVHGGILSTLLDEVMARILHSECIKAVTGELNVRFIKPVMINTKMRFAAKIEEDMGRIVKTTAKATDESGEVYVIGSAKMFKVGEWVCK